MVRDGFPKPNRKINFGEYTESCWSELSHPVLYGRSVSVTDNSTNLTEVGEML